MQYDTVEVRTNKFLGQCLGVMLVVACAVFIAPPTAQALRRRWHWITRRLWRGSKIYDRTCSPPHPSCVTVGKSSFDEALTWAGAKYLQDLTCARCPSKCAVSRFVAEVHY